MSPELANHFKFTEAVEGRLLGGLRLLGRWWPGHSGGSVAPTCVAFTSCRRHQPPPESSQQNHGPTPAVGCA